MYDRDIDLETLKHENKALNILLKDKDMDIGRLRSRVIELSSENHILKGVKKSVECKGTVLRYNDKTKK